MFDTDDHGIRFKASLGELVDTFREHIAGQEPALPPPCHVVFFPMQKAIGIAPLGPGLAAELSEIVSWARTLQAPEGMWHRRPDDTLAIIMHGRTSNDTTVIVSGGGQCNGYADLIPLPVGNSRPVTLDTLTAVTDQVCSTTAPQRAEHEVCTWAELDRLANALDEHLTSLPIKLPTPVGLSFYPRESSIVINAGGPNLMFALALLLPWTYSLGDCTLAWGRTIKDHNDDLVIGAWGHLQTNIRIKVTGYIPYPDCADVVSLTPGENQPISVPTLDTLWDQIEANRRQRNRAAKQRRCNQNS